MKTMLHAHLQQARDSLLWKLEGLDELPARWPWTPTGTNLAGIVKHAASVEIGYFGDSFSRQWTGEPLEWMAADSDDNADMWLTSDESVAEIVSLYRRVWLFADETISLHNLDDLAVVPWWSPEKRNVSLAHVITHVTSELARHAGQADILRELTDRQVGYRVESPNMPPLSTNEWAAHVARLKEVAQDAGQHRG